MNTVLFETEYLLVEKEGSLGFLTIRRPEKYNALNTKILKDLKSVLKKFHKEGEGFDTIRTLAVKGEGGKAFIAGADLEELSLLQEEDAYEFALLGQHVTFLLERIPCPVIALIDGYALGGGLELAMSCDFLWATESSRFGLPEVTLGLIPGFGGTQRLSRMVGRQMAKDLIYTGRMIQADEALRIGLVGKVLPSMSKLLDDLRKKHEEVERSAPLSIRAAKMAINQGIDLPLSEGMNLELDEFSFCFRTEDMREGVKAYLEKRRPQFKGK
jgi:enoyl-CoA hydratase